MQMNLSNHSSRSGDFRINCAHGNDCFLKNKGMGYISAVCTLFIQFSFWCTIQLTGYCIQSVSLVSVRYSVYSLVKTVQIIIANFFWQGSVSMTGRMITKLWVHWKTLMWPNCWKLLKCQPIYLMHHVTESRASMHPQ